MTPATHTPAPPTRLITGPFLSVTLTALVFFTNIGMILVLVPRFIEERLGGGEFGVGLSVAALAFASICVRPLLGPLIERFGRRNVMIVGSLVAAGAAFVSGWSTALWQVVALRAVTGIGQATMFVAAATLIADLSPRDRRAEAASYFSVAVYGGLGLGPTIGELVLGDDRFVLAFMIAAGLAATAAFTVIGVPKRVDRIVAASERTGRAPLFHRAALGPGLVFAFGIIGYAVFSAFIPDYSRQVGLAGSAGLFMLYSGTSLVLRIVGARWPERLGMHRMVTIALVSISSAMLLMSAILQPWALWTGAFLMGFGMSFLYPSLMANVVNRVDERSRASALSSFTMMSEFGNIFGGVVLGAVGQIFEKRASFLGGSIAAAIGLVLLWRTVSQSDEHGHENELDGPGPALASSGGRG